MLKYKIPQIVTLIRLYPQKPLSRQRDGKVIQAEESQNTYQLP